jgi:hypothetical protein
MRLAVLGGSDSAGQRFIKQALQHGYEVTMLSLQGNNRLHHNNLITIPGSPYSEADLTATLKNAHAVISLPDVPFTATSLGALVTCMYAYNMRRLIISTNLSPLGAANERSIASMLQQTSLDWTVVHSAPAQLLDTNFLRDNPAFTVGAKDFAQFMVGQITDVTHLQSAVMLQN